MFCRIILSCQNFHYLFRFIFVVQSTLMDLSKTGENLNNPYQTQTDLFVKKIDTKLYPEYNWLIEDMLIWYFLWYAILQISASN